MHVGRHIIGTAEHVCVPKADLQEIARGQTRPDHRGSVRPAACPRSEQINREFVWFAAVHPPNTREDMDDVVEAIDKVLSWPGF